MLEIKNKEQIEKMRRAGQVAAETLVMVSEIIRPGITGNDINDFVKNETKKKGGICAPYKYKNSINTVPFPKHCCISPDDVICHGIPNNKLLDNKIFNIDITTIIDGAHGDTSAMFFLGNITEEDKKLMKITKECLELGISLVKNNVRIGTLGYNISKHAIDNGFFVVKEFGGHGIGIGLNGFHMDPFINHDGILETGLRLPEGLTFTIEPILIKENSEIIIDKDGWTARPKIYNKSAQWEHTILITTNGYEILTNRKEKLKNSIETI